MSITISNSSGVTILGLNGHLDASTSGRAETEILDAMKSNRSPVVIDLSQVSYMSSEGLRLLIVAAKKGKEFGIRVVFASPVPMVTEVLNVSMFNRILMICPTVEQAIEQVT